MIIACIAAGIPARHVHDIFIEHQPVQQLCRDSIIKKLYWRRFIYEETA
jgi:hypothetical protein